MYLGVGYNFVADKYLFDITFNTMQIVGVIISLFFTLIVAADKMLRDSKQPSGETKCTDEDDHFQRFESPSKSEHEKEISF